MAGVIPDPLQRGSQPTGDATTPSAGRTPWGAGDNSNWQTWNGGGGNTSNQWQQFNAPANPGGALPPPGGGGGGGTAMGAYDEGGEVGSDSEGAGDSDQSGGTASLGAALKTIKDTLNYGRQQAMGGQGQQGGFAANSNQMRPSTNVEDERGSSTVGQAEGPQPKMGAAGSPLGPMPAQTAQPYPYGPQVGVGQASAGAGPVLGMDDGGDVNNPSAQGMPVQPQANQPTPQPGQVATNATPPPAMGGAQPQGQPPNKLAGYVMGAGAVSPDVAQALKQQVDPTGRMDPSMRNMLAIAAAPDQQTQWGLMQHDRQKFNAYTAFARAAASGSPQKPADIGAAANAATQAFAHVPDGTSTTFQPTQNGVVAHIKQLVAAKGKASSHEDGGPVQGFDDGGGVLPDPSTGGGDSNSTGVGGDTSQSSSQDVSIPMSNQQFQAVLAKMPYDAAMDKGAAKAFGDITGSIQGGDQGPEGDQIPPNAEETRGNVNARPGPQTTRAGRALRNNNVTTVGGGQEYAQNGGSAALPDNGVGITATLRGPQAPGAWSVNPKTGARSYTPGPPVSTISVSPHYAGGRGAGNIDTSSGLDQPGTSAGEGAANRAADRSYRNSGAYATTLKAAGAQSPQEKERDALIAKAVGADPDVLTDPVKRKALTDGIAALQRSLGGQPQGQPNQQSPDANQPQMEVQIPSAAQRVTGKLYQTPKGPARWMGNGWQVGQ